MQSGGSLPFKILSKAIFLKITTILTDRPLEENNFERKVCMTDKILAAHELTIPIPIEDRMSDIVPKKNDETEQNRHYVSDTDWNEEILKEEQWSELFCWLMLGLTALFSGIISVSMFIR